MSCGAALIEGDLNALKTYCRYHIVKGKIPTGVVKITNYNFLLTNISMITITCKQQNLTHNFVATEIQYVQNVHCGCVMQADSFVVTATSLNCLLDDNISLSFTPEYLRNFLFLTEFLSDNNELNLINDLTYLNRSIKASLPELTIAGKDYQASLAIEETSKFDLQQTINNTLEDEKIFESLGHFVMSDLLKNHYHTKDFDFLTHSIVCNYMRHFGITFNSYHSIQSEDTFCTTGRD